jgi:hypothetical protein
MNNQNNDLENTVVSTIAAASKTPFWTAFKVTLGIGLAHALMFILVIGACGATLAILSQVMK